MKYLESIRLSKSPSNSPWNSYYYRKADGNHIQKLPLQSIILTPTKNTKLSVENDVNENTSHHVVKVRGVAYSGGENTQIEKVEITKPKASINSIHISQLCKFSFTSDLSESIKN